MGFLFETQEDVGSNKDATEVIVAPELKGAIVNNPKIQELRAIKSELRLVTQEIVQELKIQGFTISHSALQAYLQGNVLGSDIRNMPIFGRATKQSHIEVLLEQFRIMRARLLSRYTQILNRPMRETVESWYEACAITGSAREKQLAVIIGKHFTTIFKWANENRLPRSARQLSAYQEMVDAYAAQLKRNPPAKKIIPARRMSVPEVYEPAKDIMDLLKRVNPQLVEKMEQKKKV